MKLSIITINKNNAAGLEKTCRSVAAQTFGDFEWIVIDGASAGGDVDIIKQYADKITFWVSEPDAGIYNAMNKGIRRARGEYCLFLNSGDCLLAGDTLRNAFAEIDGKADIYFADAEKTDHSIWYYEKNLTIKDLIVANINHQNSIIKRSLFLKHGLYNETLKIASDWEFFLNEMFMYKSRFVHIDTRLSLFDTNGISSIGSEPLREENRTVLKNVFGELAETLIEFRRRVWDNTKQRYWPFFDIVAYNGYNKVFRFLLRCYRFFVKRVYLLRKRRLPEGSPHE